MYLELRWYLLVKIGLNYIAVQGLGRLRGMVLLIVRQLEGVSWLDFKNYH